jgi:hypothetical protein
VIKNFGIVAGLLHADAASTVLSAMLANSTAIGNQLPADPDSTRPSTRSGTPSAD